MVRPGHGRRTALLGLLVLVIAATASSTTRVNAQFFPEQEPTNAEIQFGCDPGPIEELEVVDPPLPPGRIAAPWQPAVSGRLIVRADRPGHEVVGSGFNLEHTLWSCPWFRRVLDRWVLEPFQPEIARVDTGQLPLAPEGVPAEELGWDDYQRIMDDSKYQPSWQMLKRLDDEGVRLMLGVWGGPGAFNDDGTRRGRLLPQYVDNYVEYYAAVVDYIVRQQGINVWTATVMNEPDGGDGTLIDPDLFVEVARRLGPRLAAYGVKLYGPDTASAANAIPYVERMLEDPDVMQHFGAIATHEYFVEHALEDLIQVVRAGGSDLPVVVTEYVSFQFGAMDRGQEATNEVGHMLVSLQVFASLMSAGADAALYWDAVDYYQAGHAAITRWGLLQGPAESFEPRKRYYGFLQILPYLQRGSRVLETWYAGPPESNALAVAGGPGREGEVMIAILNRAGPIELQLEFWGSAPPQLQVYVTDADRDNEHAGRVRVVNRRANVYVAARSVTTLSAAPSPADEDE